MVIAVRDLYPASLAKTEGTLLTFKEAMSYLRVSRSTLYRLVWSSQLVGHKVGSTWRFYRDDLEACIVPELSREPHAQE